MLHRNTNKITLILIYAVLEWILIVLLLLNSLFSYLILKFAEFFGLKSPCPWCTRLDHIFDPAKGDNNMNRYLLCEVHAEEISKLGFCSNHRKLVDSQGMCEDCLSSRPEFENSSKNFGLMKGFGGFQNGKEKVGENGEVSLNCTCCGVSLDDSFNNKYSSYILLKTSSWDDVLECAQKENLIIEAGDCDDNHVQEFCAGDEKVLEDENENQLLFEFDGNLEVTEKDNEENGCISVIVNELKDKEILEEENSTLILKNKSVQVCVEEEAPLEISPQHLEFFLDYSGHRLVPVELIDSVTEEHKIEENAKIEDDDDRNKDQDFTLDSEARVDEKEDMVLRVEAEWRRKWTHFLILISMRNLKEFEDFKVFPLAQWPSEEAGDVQELAREQHSDVHTDNVACEEEVSPVNNENEADVSIGTEIPDLDITDEIQIQDSHHSYESIHEYPSTNSTNPYTADDHGPTQIEEQNVEIQSLLVHDNEHVTSNQTSFPAELNEIEEDKKLLLLEKRDSGIEESLDGSVTSELDGGDGVVTVERLKTALRAERKALQALYAELEEERSASAVATNQTMAMINRLQEEKAAMQMEALQYQRMMEEQSEYDQEALQLLNELMVKREKEKQELERELEVYRKKLSDYETKEKNEEAKEDEGFYGNSDYKNQNTPVDAVVNLEESLEDFEEERLSILEQLKFLEEKLLTLDDDKEQHFEDVKPLDKLDEQNGNHVDENAHFNGEANGHSNGLLMNGKHHQQRRIFEMENKKLAVEEEVDHLYERLQALEADREFLKHCISSLKKGDKGMDLLQEILQHLRDLRNVELRIPFSKVIRSYGLANGRR
ncbi:hypothetical protein DH2020_043837 [Rehmannia glutinosa]|uniref:GTD-binding domain-containing protein n=1 Tax=Rehmannia glutinosa TaxID=99300 RepID=A0ABR0UJQ0_REHGL